MATKSTAQQRRKSRRRAAIVIVPAVAGVFVAGTAFAYWTTSGTGSGSGDSGTTQAVTVSQTSTVTNLVPGGADQNVDFKINNPKSTSQRVNGVTIAVSTITTAGGVAIPTTGVGVSCSPADFLITQPAALNADVPNGDTVFSSSGAKIHMINAAYNQNGCQNAIVNLSLTAA
jgi:hypothetical protein